MEETFNFIGTVKIRAEISHHEYCAHVAEHEYDEEAQPPGPDPLGRVHGDGGDGGGRGGVGGRGQEVEVGEDVEETTANQVAKERMHCKNCNDSRKCTVKKCSERKKCTVKKVQKAERVSK